MLSCWGPPWCSINPYAEYMYDGVNISPFEVMFVKVGEEGTQAGGKQWGVTRRSTVQGGPGRASAVHGGVSGGMGVACDDAAMACANSHSPRPCPRRSRSFCWRPTGPPQPAPRSTRPGTGGRWGGAGWWGRRRSAAPGAGLQSPCRRLCNCAPLRRIIGASIHPWTGSWPCSTRSRRMSTPPRRRNCGT